MRLVHLAAVVVALVVVAFGALIGSDNMVGGGVVVAMIHALMAAK